MAKDKRGNKQKMSIKTLQISPAAIISRTLLHWKLSVHMNGA